MEEGLSDPRVTQDITIQHSTSHNHVLVPHKRGQVFTWHLVVTLGTFGLVIGLRVACQSRMLFKLRIAKNKVS